MRIRQILILLLTIFSIAACSLEPKYKTPNSPIDLKTDDESQKNQDLYWKKFFKSNDLKKIIQLALDNNHDLRIAHLNIQSAKANYGVVRADLLPNIEATGSATRKGVPSAFSSFIPQTQYDTTLALTSYEIDFVGKLKSLKRTALEDYFATKQALEIIRISLISETANSYVQLLLDKEMLKIADRIFIAQEKKHLLIKAKYEQGIVSKSELLESSILLENAKITQIAYESLIEQGKHSLLLLTAVSDEKLLPLDDNLNDLKIDESLIDFIPSTILLSRPDVKQAEHSLRSANANIGAARAAFFPSISLTASYGYSAQQFSDLFSSNSWNFSPQINIPIFDGGRNKANLNIAKIEKYVEIAQYEKVIRTAFREAKDELEKRETIYEQLKLVKNILETQKKLHVISVKKHQFGISSMIDLSNAEISLLSVEQQNAEVKRDHLVNLITLYKTFGGGREI